MTTEPGPAPDTVTIGQAPRRPIRLELVVVSGKDVGKRLALEPGVYLVGSSPECQLCLVDDGVSRRHLEITVDDRVTARDLGSKNGSYFLGARFETLVVDAGSAITIGKTALCVASAEEASLPIWPLEQYGALRAGNLTMRRAFAEIDRLAKSDASLLLIAETGCGKELAAQAIHAGSPRHDQPFVVCDVSALSNTLIEGELFGFVRGAFTGADRDRAGLLEQAHGGTLFLDEIGELPLDLQPRLLRALEAGEVRRIGETHYRTIDVRVVAATHRSLAQEVDAGTFRADLFHRLAVAQIRLPPLRERRDDVALLAGHFLTELGQRAGRRFELAPGTATALCHYDWPGNVRQLRNVLERATALAPDDGVIGPELLGLDQTQRGSAGANQVIDVELPLKDARERLIDSWERDYVLAQIARSEGNVTHAARRAGIDRSHFHRLMRKYHITK